MQSHRTSQALANSFPFLCLEACTTGMSTWLRELPNTWLRELPNPSLPSPQALR